jgi:hypothetical protein
VRNTPPKNLIVGGTTADLKCGGKFPKKREPRPGEIVWKIRPRPEPPPGWRPDSLRT